MDTNPYSEFNSLLKYSLQAEKFFRKSLTKAMREFQNTVPVPEDQQSLVLLAGSAALCLNIFDCLLKHAEEEGLPLTPIEQMVSLMIQHLKKAEEADK